MSLQLLHRKACKNASRPGPQPNNCMIKGGQGQEVTRRDKRVITLPRAFLKQDSSVFLKSEDGPNAIGTVAKAAVKWREADPVCPTVSDIGQK